MGEGGAVYTDSPKLKRIVESFRDWGRDCYCPSGKDNTCGVRFGLRKGSSKFSGRPRRIRHEKMSHCEIRIELNRPLEVRSSFSKMKIIQ